MLSSTLLLLSYQLTAPPGAGLAPIRASAVRMSAAEDAAKAAWLAKQDAPAFGSRATFGPQRMSSAGEEAAKAAWLAKMDAPAWSKAAEANIRPAQARYKRLQAVTSRYKPAQWLGLLKLQVTSYKLQVTSYKL